LVQAALQHLQQYTCWHSPCQPLGGFSEAAASKVSFSCWWQMGIHSTKQTAATMRPPACHHGRDTLHMHYRNNLYDYAEVQSFLPW